MKKMVPGLIFGFIIGIVVNFSPLMDMPFLKALLISLMLGLVCGLIFVGMEKLLKKWRENSLKSG